MSVRSDISIMQETGLGCFMRSLKIILYHYESAGLLKKIIYLLGTSLIAVFYRLYFKSSCIDCVF